MCRHQSDDSMSQSFQNKAYDFANGGHFKNVAPKWRIQWHDVSGNSFSEIYAPENLHIESTMIALRLLVSESFWCHVHVCQIWCFYHKMHDSLIFGHLAAGLLLAFSFATIKTQLCSTRHRLGCLYSPSVSLQSKHN